MSIFSTSPRLHTAQADTRPRNDDTAVPHRSASKPGRFVGHGAVVLQGEAASWHSEVCYLTSRRLAHQAIPHRCQLIERNDGRAGEGITAGKPVYPSSITKQFAFEKKPLAVYEGEASIKLPLKIASNVSQGAHTLRAKLRVQACDDQACYPPRTIETSIPVTVK